MTDPETPSAARPLEEPPPTGEPRLDALARLLALVDRLRAPDGCPWDLKQTEESFAPSLVEEAHEVVEAVEDRDPEAVVEEAGDLLMGVFLLARIAQDEGRGDLARMANGVTEKLVRRHPHVFGSARADDADQVLESWDRIKRREREEQGTDPSAVAGVPAALPALQRAARVGHKAMAAGFRWDSPRGALEKLREELGELEEVLGSGGPDPADPDGSAPDPGALEEELGDVLLAGALLGAYHRVDPERAARRAVRRFEARFRRVEAELGPDLGAASEAELRAAWARAKAAER